MKAADWIFHDKFYLHGAPHYRTYHAEKLRKYYRLTITVRDCCYAKRAYTFKSLSAAKKAALKHSHDTHVLDRI